MVFMQFNFELIGNTLDDTHGIGIMIDGNPANVTLSHGHIVRGNTIRNKVNPPSDRHCGPNGRIGACSRADTHYAITVNTPVSDAFSCPERCVSDVVVEGNTVVVAKGNGTCDSNGLFVSALHSVASGNDCTVEA